MKVVKDCSDLMVHNNGVVLAWLTKRDDKEIELEVTRAATLHEWEMIEHVGTEYDDVVVTKQESIDDKKAAVDKAIREMNRSLKHRGR